jgi:hypothetical protein
MKQTLKQTLSRRSLLKAAMSAGAAAVAAPYVLTSSALGADGAVPASDRIVMAGIGMGGQGWGDLNGFMGHKEVQVAAVCDVKHADLKKAKSGCEGRYGPGIQATTDYREILARTDIDAIVCGTPDHWHAQVSIDACKSGKDVYCEKPLSLTIREGRKMVEAARRYGRVFSCGSQRVIGDYGRLACAARSGKYGKIVEAFADPGGPPRPCYLGGVPIPPDTIEWDMWLGPAPWVPYHPFRCGQAYGLGGQGFRTWSDYSGGMMTDWGGHKFGGAMHGMGVDHTGPTDVLLPDGKDVKYLTYVFANGMRLNVGGEQGYRCELGMVKPQRQQKVPPGLRWYNDGAHDPISDLVGCIKTRKKPFQDVEYAHRAATVCHLGNITLKLGRNLKWDPDKEEFVNDVEANRLVDRPRRGPWQI